ncbi:hypothetical protein PR048_016816 [Dryococelus australis]|uniref:Uncharacterized protein n=1 Tax=Dryococelus australis TaxID=614101 RepID=A0ABQ9H7V3_9NEOP|nr:hypothetical protein PR048_016816 [Dryococelus australis]
MFTRQPRSLFRGPGVNRDVTLEELVPLRFQQMALPGFLPRTEHAGIRPNCGCLVDTGVIIHGERLPEKLARTKDPSQRSPGFRDEYGAAPECKGGGKGDPSDNPPTSGIVRLDSYTRKSGSYSAGNRTRFVKVGGE